MTSEQRTDTSWFKDLGLGVFIHWGHASTRGWELSWQMTGGVTRQKPELEPVGCEDYFTNAKTFDPDRFDPAAWAELAWRAGARYMVFTAKHHDGFAMFDTALSDYSVVRTAPCGRDVTAELVDAFRARGFRIGLYFSIVDWHHPDYPRYTDETINKPYVIGSYPTAPEKWERYRAFMLGQLAELLTGYGAIDIVWLDGEFEHTEAEWRFGEIRELIRAHQPAALVNDRCVGHGDFATPEQQLPVIAPDRPWEACLTMNSTWGYVPWDQTWRSPAAILHTAIEAVSMGGNLLLNLAPRGDGSLPAEAVERLEALAGWYEQNGESVRGVEPGLELWQFHGPSTRRRREDGRETLYLHLTSRPYESVAARGMPVNRVERVSVLGDGRELSFTVHPRLSDIHARTLDPLGELRIQVDSSLLDPLCTVLAVDLAAPNAD
jgi:alpha-L-fucosidase